MSTAAGNARVCESYGNVKRLKASHNPAVFMKEDAHLATKLKSFSN